MVITAVGAIGLTASTSLALSAAANTGRDAKNLLMAVNEGPGGNGKPIKYGSTKKSAKKLGNQMNNRGWTKETVQDTVDNPYTTRQSTNKSTGNSATAYYTEDGAYVIIDDVTNEVVQVSDRFDSKWVPDPSIKDPYIR
jgi:hypothetical protein